MIPVLTKLQIDKTPVQPNRPLLICDVDEVIVHFIRDFEQFLGDRGLRLVITGFQLSGSIHRLDTERPLVGHECAELVAEFFDERTHAMQPIEGAIESLQAVSTFAEVVLLTNLPIEAGDARRQNLKSHGLDFPVITNTGPKGPAIKALAAKSNRAVAFVDDSPNFIESSHEYAPHVTTVHFLQDPRFAPHAPDHGFIGLRSDNWVETLDFLRRTLYMNRT